MHSRSTCACDSPDPPPQSSDPQLPVVSLLLINASHGNFSLKWVEASGDHYGNGGDKWVDEHVEAFVNIAGPMLGVAKCVLRFCTTASFEALIVLSCRPILIPNYAEPWLPSSAVR